MIELNKNFNIPAVDITGKRTFTNPLSDDNHADPCIVYCEREKCYYGISTGKDSLTIHRTEKFEDMFSKSEARIAYESNAKDDTYSCLWAPELHYINGKWYIYTSCQNGPDDYLKHIIVLEAKTDSPFDGFKICGHINRDVYAIDPSVYQDTENGRLFILYSANGCWSDDYAIGLLEFKGGEMANADSWEKYPDIILKKGNGNYGPGHATFFYSPDKSELWICHHCLESSNPEVKRMKRRCHCQRVFFDETGFVHIGELAPSGVPFAIPS